MLYMWFIGFLSLGLIMPEFISQFSDYYGYFIFRILPFLLVFTGVWALGRYLFVPVVDRLLTGRDIDDHVRKPLLTIARIVVLIVGVGVAFGVAGFNNFFSSLVTIGAAGTLAIGFALKSLISNYVSGVLIFLERSFRIGDWIECDGFEGVVEDIQMRTTRLKTFDNEMLTVPNSKLTDSVVKNPVAKEKLRLRFEFSVDYGEDVGKAMTMILEEAKKIDAILDEPESTVRLTELEDSHVGLESRFWIEDPDRTDFVNVRSQYAKAVKKRFNEEGIKIPFPQRDLSGEVKFSEMAAQSDS